MTVIYTVGGILLGAALAVGTWQIIKQISRDIINIDTPKEAQDE